MSSRHVPIRDVLPSSEECERAVLGAILLDNSAFEQAPELREEDFYLDSHRCIFRRIREMFSRGIPADLPTLGESLIRNKELETVGGAVYISSLTDGIPQLANIEHYVRIVKEHAARRRLIYSCRAVEERARNGPVNIPELTKWAQDQIGSITVGAGDPVGILLSDVQPERVDWLWKGRIPFGRITILDGDPGLGKSLLTLEIAARLSRGERLPGDKEASIGGSVILSAEDGLADTIAPRLIGAGADRSRILALKYCPDRPGEVTVSQIPLDISTIEAAVRRVDAKFLIVDVLAAYLPETTNTNRDQHVRLALAPLSEMATRLRIAVICIRHLNKTPSGNPLYRGGGSIGIIGAARAGLVVGRDPADPETFVLANTKQNLGPPMPSLSYRIQANEDGVPQIQWTGESQHTAASLLAIQPSEQRDALEEGIEFLSDILATGARKQAELVKEAKLLGISEPTLRRAKQKLRVKSRKVGSGSDSYWVWELPSNFKGAQSKT
jgi:hypothetical protein